VECHREDREVEKIKSPSLLFLRKVGEKIEKFMRKDDSQQPKKKLPELHKVTNSGHTCSWRLFLLSVVRKYSTMRAMSSDRNECQQVAFHSCANKIGKWEKLRVLASYFSGR